MMFEFKVSLRAVYDEIHIVRVEAASEQEARTTIYAGNGDYISSDDDGMIDSEITDIQIRRPPQ